ncbi:MAG TPA: peptidoglycan-binding protein [Candidatus Limiplasma pullistercoris]|nr:peptidoglycan-binding protein [Candidatus Limiplasma pullistercoris]
MRVFLRALSFRMLALALILTLLAAPQALAATKYTTLEFGSRGSDVLQLQKALLELGFNPNGTDGKFGRGTETAVKAYQAARGLEVDGKAGTLTLTMLYGETSGESGTITTPVTTNPNTLKYGDSGSRVTELQTALVKLGYNTNGVDGRFGAGTQRAVISFQKDNGLEADGLAGTKTLELLYAKANGSGSSSGSSSGTSTGLTRTLRRGYTGDDVIAVQERLKELGYYTGSIDGVYGSGSIAAATAFQKNNGLKVDGLTGQSTYAALFSSSAVAAGSSSSSGSSSSGSSSTYVKLQSGDKGTEVKKLQQALKDLGYDVSADGTYGPITVAAVIAFQKLNGLDDDGIAGAKTQTVLYSGNAKRYDSSSSSSSGGSSSGSTGTTVAPNGATIQLLHWFDDVKPTLKNGQNLIAYDPDTGISWTLRIMSRGNHADVEPLTAADTAAMFQAFGNKESWGPKVVYIKLPDGRWSIASTHNVAHGSQTISDNNFDGQNCVHFLRDMDECKQNDPDYGVQNQEAIREAWKKLTGITVN